MRARINGHDEDIAAGASVADVVERFLPAARWAAVVLDGEVCPRGAWPTTGVAEGARVEILTPTQGG